MENLIKYLDGRKKKDFADSIGISSSFLSQILTGHRNVSGKLAFRIENATDGNVPASSFFKVSSKDALKSAQISSRAS